MGCSNSKHNYVIEKIENAWSEAPEKIIKIQLLYENKKDFLGEAISNDPKNVSSDKKIQTDGELEYSETFDGFGKLLHKNLNLYYEGPMKSGEPNGNDCTFYHRELVGGSRMVQYRGGVNKGLRDGFGTEYWPNGNKRFYGLWKNGFMESSSIEEDTFPNVCFFF
jgi:antitoxin component YwqK of YwqJK toxin-antitoxin module